MRISYIIPALLFSALLARGGDLNANDATTSDSSKTLYIVHGYKASPTDHWFSWLKDQARQYGLNDVIVVAMPEPDNPNAEKWHEALMSSVNDINAKVYLVAHSLGSISTLRFLSEQRKGDQIGGLILVSGFEDRLPVIPDLDPFMEEPYSVQSVKGLSDQITVIAAKDDGIVPYQLSRKLAQNLDAQFVLLDKGGHVLASDGFETFPLLWDHLSQMMDHP